MISALCTALMVCAQSPSAQQLEFVSQYTMEKTDDRLGGLSSLELSDDGTQFLMTTDKGSFVAGNIVRDGTTMHTENVEVTTMVGRTGRPMNFFRRDAEGLAIGKNGEIFVSYEGWHVVMEFDDIDKVGRNLPRDKIMRTWKDNSGLEALAIDDDGTLYAVPERSGDLNRPFPVLRFDGKRWNDRLSVPRSDGFLATGADIGPDGRFYLLERKFLGFFGFATRVRSFEVTDDAMIDQQVLLTTATGTHHNLEGISVWRDSDDALRVTLVADDNFKSYLRSEIVEYRLPAQIN